MGLRAPTVAAAALLLLLAVVQLTAANDVTYSPRRILFAKCDGSEEETVKPKSAFMTCVNTRGVCEVRTMHTHTLRIVFVPKINSTDVDSHARWNSWFQVPLPGQTRDACGDGLDCPVIAGQTTRFTYHLEIQNFWPRDEFPVIWSLTDRETNIEIMCIKFRISIV